MSELTKMSSPPAPNFRYWSRGAGLAEMLAVAGKWDEFDHLLKVEPTIARAIVKWVFLAEDSEAPALTEARRRAALVGSQS